MNLWPRVRSRGFFRLIAKVLVVRAGLLRSHRMPTGRNERERAKWKRFGTAVTEARRAAGLTQAELARRIGERADWVGRIEHARRKTCIVEVVALCEALGIAPSKIMKKI